MNKLWVRLSLSFVAVILAVTIVAGFATYLASESNFGRGSPPPPEVQAYLEEARRDNLLAPVPMIIMVGAVATVAGIWMSRTLTKPMAELGEAAQAIGRQDLSRRVSIKGTDEVQTLAQRFNEMAEQLEDEEELRSNLLADVAHELRNPLHVLRGNLQAILDGVYPLSKEEIARLADQTRHLTALVDDLHELAQAEAHQLPLYKQETDMAELVKQTVVAFRAIAASKEIEVQVELLGAIPNLKVDPERIRQALNNLLTNALQHTPNGGRINVTAEEQEGNFCISVQDSGAGISKEDLPRVFDRFYRSDPARSRDSGGSGLGLAIVEAVITEHSGKVTAISPGSELGSIFTIYLPVGL
jgi:signal transduction histidine kinase